MYAISYTQPANGTLTIRKITDNSEVPSGSTVEVGTVLNIEATPTGNYYLDNIKVNGTILENTSTITIEQATTVEAFFSLNKYEITYTQPTNGTLVVRKADDNSEVASGSTVEYGTVLNIEAKPENGYHLVRIEANGEAIAGTQITIEAKTNINAVFAIGTGIAPAEQTTLVIYPNPTTDVITVRSEYPKGAIIVTDINGRVVSITDIKSVETQINIQNLPTGTYLVKVGNKVERMIKK